jgi:uncharacterized damage-inducible protein DinB
MIKNFIDEYTRYRLLGEKTMAQVSDEDLNRVIGEGTNSIAMIVRHISGNLISRFTDFLTTDGEKPWRNRESEFEEVEYTREQVDQLWSQGWQALEAELAALTDADLDKQITIRGQAHTVHEALCRSLAHVALHTGQIILLGRIMTGGDWKWLTIPKGKSEQYNRNPTMEKRPI